MEKVATKKVIVKKTILVRKRKSKQSKEETTVEPASGSHPGAEAALSPPPQKRQKTTPAAPEDPSPSESPQIQAQKPKSSKPSSLLTGACDACALLVHVFTKAIPGIRGMFLRPDPRKAIITFDSWDNVHRAAAKSPIEVEGESFVLQSGPNPEGKNLFLGGKLLQVLKKLLASAVGPLRKVQWASSMMEGTLHFEEEADAKQALATGRFPLAPGQDITLRPFAAQARLFFDLPRLLHNVVAEAMPNQALVELRCSKSLQSALATLWSEEDVKKALKMGTAVVAGREVRLTTRKSHSVGFSGEYE